VEGSGGGVQLGWVDPGPFDIDDVTAYPRIIEFYRGFPQTLCLDPNDFLRAPNVDAPVGPRPALRLTWDGNFLGRGWEEKVWPAVLRGVNFTRFSDWVFQNGFHGGSAWMQLLATAPDLARGVSGLSIGHGGYGGRPESELTDLYPLTPSLCRLHLVDCEWSPGVIRRLGDWGLSKQLQSLTYHGGAHSPTAERVLRTMAEMGDWPSLASLTLQGLEGVRPEVLRLVNPEMFPHLKSVMFYGGGGTAEFFSALLAATQFARVERVTYWGQLNPELELLQDRSAGRFVLVK
jgi:hypothetical protein